MRAPPSQELKALLKGEPLLLGYQQKTVRQAMAAPVLVVEKGRRTGGTWGLGSAAVLTAGAKKSAGGMDVFYIAYEKDMTREFIDTCAGWAKLFGAAASTIKEELIKDGDKDILVYCIKFSSGFEIKALSSRPRNLRSRQGWVIADEFAFCDDQEELLKAAFAFLIWGGRVTILSTHNGAANPFALLCDDVRAGTKPYELIKFDLDDALNDGLYRRICMMRGEVWSQEAQDKWRADLIATYGDGADEELFCKPTAGAGTWISDVLIAQAVDPAAGDPAFYGGGPCFIGNDIARRRDRWVAVVLERIPTGLLVLRETVTLRDAPFVQHDAEIKRLMEKYNVARMWMDQTGMGERSVEAMVGAHGAGRVQGKLMTPAIRLSLATEAKRCFELGGIMIGDDPMIRSDLRKIKRSAGPGGTIRLETTRDSSGHADSAWALFLAVAAAATGVIATSGYTALSQASAGAPPPSSLRAVASALPGRLQRLASNLMGDWRG